MSTTSSRAPDLTSLVELDTDVSSVLLVAAVTGTTDPAAIAVVLGNRSRDVVGHLVTATASGLSMDDVIRPESALNAGVIDTVTPLELDDLHQRVIQAHLRPGSPNLEVARALVDSGCRDQRLAEHLLVSSAAAETDSPMTPGDVLDLAHRAGADPLVVAARRAEAAASVGDFDLALQCSDDVLAHPEHPELPRAIRAAVVAHAHRGSLHHSSALFTYLGADRVGEDAAFAAWAHIGTGDGDQARVMFDAATHTPPTTSGRSMMLLARGLEQTLRGDGLASLPTLVQSAAAMRPVGRTVVAPESPAALAALAALSCGELDTAASVLEAAIAAELCGSAAQPRHRLLLAWTAMLRGDLECAECLVTEVTEAGPPEMRDALFIHALRVGLARRASDIPALAEAWAAAGESLTGHSVDLYSLLPLGELSVAAARLREGHRLRYQLDEADRILGRLEQPPLWSAMYHWCGVHAAILAEQPSALIPHAEALVAASRTSPFAEALATAGNVWMQVLQQQVDPQAVHAATAGLERVGLSWDAIRLAGQAAARTSNRQDMLELMQLARSLQRSGGADTAGGRDAGGTDLTEREWEVAGLVIDGVSYRDIGARLFISPKTVEHHVARIRRRLGVETRQEMLEILRDLRATQDESA